MKHVKDAHSNIHLYCTDQQRDFPLQFSLLKVQTAKQFVFNLNILFEPLFLLFPLPALIYTIKAGCLMLKFNSTLGLSTKQADKHSLMKMTYSLIHRAR